MITTYKNSFHVKHNATYGPAEYTTDAKPTEYKGYLIYERIKGSVWDIVKDGTCIHQMAGLNGAKSHIDEMTAPKNAWGVKVNSQQLRMDKAARRYGARVRRGANTVRYL